MLVSLGGFLRGGLGAARFGLVVEVHDLAEGLDLGPALGLRLRSLLRGGPLGHLIGALGVHLVVPGRASLLEEGRASRLREKGPTSVSAGIVLRELVERKEGNSAHLCTGGQDQKEGEDERLPPRAGPPTHPQKADRLWLLAGIDLMGSQIRQEGAGPHRRVCDGLQSVCCVALRLDKARAANHGRPLRVYTCFPSPVVRVSSLAPSPDCTPPSGARGRKRLSVFSAAHWVVCGITWRVIDWSLGERGQKLRRASADSASAPAPSQSLPSLPAATQLPLRASTCARNAANGAQDSRPFLSARWAAARSPAATRPAPALNEQALTMRARARAGMLWISSADAGDGSDSLKQSTLTGACEQVGGMPGPSAGSLYASSPGGHAAVALSAPRRHRVSHFSWLNRPPLTTRHAKSPRRRPTPGARRPSRGPRSTASKATSSSDWAPSRRCAARARRHLPRRVLRLLSIDKAAPQTRAWACQTEAGWARWSQLPMVPASLTFAWLSAAGGRVLHQRNQRAPWRLPIPLCAPYTLPQSRGAHSCCAPCRQASQPRRACDYAAPPSRPASASAPPAAQLAASANPRGHNNLRLA